MATEDYSGKVPELRSLFQKKYADALQSGAYDDSDVKTVETEDVYLINILRMLKVKGDVEKGADMIDTVLKFRKEMGIPGLTLDSFPREFVEEIQKNNTLFYKNRDKDGHKLLFFRVSANKKGKEVETVKRFIAYHLEQHYSESPQEQIVLVFDFTDAGVTNMDLDVTKFIISCLTTYFPVIAAYIMMYDMPVLLSAIWKIIRGWLNDEQAKRIKHVKKSEVEEYISADQLLEHMGPKSK